jgi:hypothetical protein
MCPNCSRWLAFEAFNRDQRRHGGLSSWCRECAAEGTRDWRRRNPEYIDAYNEARRTGPRERTCADCGEHFTAAKRGAGTGALR